MEPNRSEIYACVYDQLIFEKWQDYTLKKEKSLHSVEKTR